MNILNIDKDRIKETIIDTLTQVYGEKYKDIINREVIDTSLFIYGDEGSFNDYHKFLLDCKEKELYLDFFKLIGIQIPDYYYNNLVDEFDDYIKSLVDNYFGDSYCCGSNNEPYIKTSGLYSFINFFKTNSTESTTFTEHQIKFINFLRKEKDFITIDNFDKFKETDDFKRISKEIDELITIYNNLLKEYKNFAKSIEFYKNYSDKKERQSQILLDNLKIKLLDDWTPYLPDALKTHFKNHFKTKKGCINTLIPEDFDSKTNIEYFSKSDEIELENNSSDIVNKICIYYYRLKYLNDIGINISSNIVEIENIENLNVTTRLEKYKQLYNNLLKQENIRLLIPNQKMINKFIFFKEESINYYAQLLFFDHRDYKELSSSYKYDIPISILNLIYNQGTFYSLSLNNKNKFQKVVFIVSDTFSKGRANYAILHEFIHAMNYTVNSQLGIEKLVFGKTTFNPYNNSISLFELLEETFTDLLTLEANDILRKNNQELLASQSLSSNQFDTVNTHIFLKNIIRPLYNNYKDEWIYANVTGNFNRFFKLVRKKHLIELNDVVNKVNYLIRNDLLFQLELLNLDNDLVKEYKQEIYRAKEIYKKMGLSKTKKKA